MRRRPACCGQARPVAQHTLLVRGLRRRHAAGGGCLRFAWTTSCLHGRARLDAPDLSGPSARSTMPSPEAAPWPVSALMFTGASPPPACRARASRAAAHAPPRSGRLVAALAEEGVEGRYSRPAPARPARPSRACGTTARPTPRAPAPTRAQRSPRRRACVRPLSSRLRWVRQSPSRNCAGRRRPVRGMAEQHDRAFAQCVQARWCLRRTRLAARPAPAGTARARQRSSSPDCGPSQVPDAPHGHTAGCPAGC